jgi:hypothetical protein
MYLSKCSSISLLNASYFYIKNENRRRRTYLNGVAKIEVKLTKKEESNNKKKKKQTWCCSASWICFTLFSREETRAQIVK